MRPSPMTDETLPAAPDPEPPSGSRPDFSPEPEGLDSIDICRLAQAGDRAALNELLARYQERIYRIARIRMGAKLRRFLDSADIVNRANWVAAQRIGKLEVRDKASIIQWLSKIV